MQLSFRQTRYLKLSIKSANNRLCERRFWVATAQLLISVAEKTRRSTSPDNFTSEVKTILQSMNALSPKKQPL